MDKEHSSAASVEPAGDRDMDSLKSKLRRHPAVMDMANPQLVKGASGVMNSPGLLNLVQIAGEGLAPKSQCRVYLAESNHAPFGRFQALAALKTNPDEAGIVQTIGSRKRLVPGGSRPPAAPSERFLIVTHLTDSAHWCGGRPTRQRMIEREKS